ASRQPGRRPSAPGARPRSGSRCGEAMTTAAAIALRSSAARSSSTAPPTRWTWMSTRSRWGGWSLTPAEVPAGGAAPQASARPRRPASAARRRRGGSTLTLVLAVVVADLDGQPVRVGRGRRRAVDADQEAVAVLLAPAAELEHAVVGGLGGERLEG